MLQGYVKFYRKSLESAVWKNRDLWRFWTWCLLKATHKEMAQMVGYQEVLLQPGQFIFGRHKASEETGLSERKIRTCLDQLSKRKNVTINSTNRFSVITIVNWDEHQVEPTNETSSKRPANDQQTTTNKNVKNDKNIIKGGNFKPPSLEEVEEYCKERGNDVAPQKWHDFYSSKGWMVGKNKMKDWKAAVRTWEGSNPKPQTSRGSTW